MRGNAYVDDRMRPTVSAMGADLAVDSAQQAELSGDQTWVQRQGSVQVRNLLIKPVSRDRHGVGLIPDKPLRLAVERLAEGGLQVQLVENAYFAGFGADLTQAIDDLMGLLHDDYQFYSNTPDEKLAEDALEVKAQLLNLFSEAPQ